MITETLPLKLSTDWISSTEKNFDWEKAEDVAITFKQNLAANSAAQSDPDTTSTRDVCMVEDRILRVLMVEDSQDDCELICFQLERCGYRPRLERVFCEEMMRKALEQDKWDIVFTDHGTPGFSGTAAIELLERMQQRIPVICITGTLDPVVTRRMLAVGARACICKDDLSLLCTTVQRALNGNSNRE
jgi:CheY-like chemotaxis protein